MGIVITFAFELIEGGWSVSKPTIIGSNNGLSPARRQAIIWTFIVNWTLRIKRQWNFNGNSYICVHENACEYVVWKMAILSGPQCVKQLPEPSRITVMIICKCLSTYSSMSTWRQLLWPLYQLISPWTKWPPFRKRHFQTHFHELNILYFD